MRLNREAATTPKIRDEIISSNEAAFVLTERYVVSEQTVYK